MEADDIASICQLKYQYFRHLDLKEYDQLGELLTEDCVARYDDGNLTFEGRAAIVEFLTSAMGNNSLISKHHGHHPEITLSGSDSAHGVWYLEDSVIIPGADLEISGTAFYEDTYRRVDGLWRIAETGYARVFEEQREFSTKTLKSFKHRFES